MGPGDVSERQRIIGDDCENCPLWSILKGTLLCFRYYSEIVPVRYLYWLMGQYFCAFMCGEVQSVGESHFS